MACLLFLKHDKDGDIEHEAICKLTKCCHFMMQWPVIVKGNAESSLERGLDAFSFVQTFKLWTFDFV